MINMIPGVGWLLDFVSKVSLAVPFWFIWTLCGIGDRFFYWLPPVYLRPGFWDCVGIFIVVPILHWLVVPKLAKVSQKSGG